jgi:polyadenylation factor subunit 2
MEFPPPEMSMPPPSFQPPQHNNFHQPRWNNPNFHHNKPFYKSYKHGMQVQDDFDGKRLRKSVMRKTVDYNSSIIKALEVRHRKFHLSDVL